MANTTVPFCLSVANSTVNIDYNFLQTIHFCGVYTMHGFCIPLWNHRSDVQVTI